MSTISSQPRLTPYLTRSTSEQLRQHRKAEAYHNTIAKIYTIATPIILTGITVAIYATAPQFLFGALFAAPQILSIAYTHFVSPESIASLHFKKEATLCEKILERQQQLESQTDEQLRELVIQYGVTPVNTITRLEQAGVVNPSIRTIIPLIAQYQIKNEHFQELRAQFQQAHESTHTGLYEHGQHKQLDESIRMSIETSFMNAYESLESKILLLKIEAAALIHLMAHPDQVQSPLEGTTLHPLPLSSRMLDRYFLGQDSTYFGYPNPQNRTERNNLSPTDILHEGNSPQNLRIVMFGA